MRTTGDVSYLDRDTDATAPQQTAGGPPALLPLGGIRYVVLYCSLDASGRGVFAMTMPAAERGVVVVLHPSAAVAREVTGVLLERLWREARGQAAQVRRVSPAAGSQGGRIDIEHTRDNWIRSRSGVRVGTGQGRRRGRMVAGSQMSSCCEGVEHLTSDKVQQWRYLSGGWVSDRSTALRSACGTLGASSRHHRSSY